MSVAAVRRFSPVPLLMLLAIGGSWGAVPSIARYAVTGGVRPMGYVFWVGLGAAAICWAMCLARGVRPRFARRHLVYYLLSGCTRFVLAGFVMYTALGHVPAGLIAIAIGTSPLLTFIAQLAFRFERFTWPRAAGVVVGLAGIGLMFGPGASLPAGVGPNWLALGFVPSLIYAFSNITIDRTRPAGEDSLALTAGMFTLVVVLALPLALAAGQFHPVWRGGLTLPEAAMFAHATIIAVCFFGLYELIRRTDATFGSQTTYVTTLTGILFGMVLLGERPTVWVWAAAALILGGVALVNSSGKVRREGGAA